MLTTNSILFKNILYYCVLIFYKPIGIVFANEKTVKFTFVLKISWFVRFISVTNFVIKSKITLIFYDSLFCYRNNIARHFIVIMLLKSFFDTIILPVNAYKIDAPSF